jgi:hypothetical protein
MARRLFIVVLLAPLSAWGALDLHRGWFRETCGGGYFHIPNVKELGGDELVMTVGGGFPGPGLGAYVTYGKEIWTEVPAERCDARSKCTPLQGAKIWFDKPERRFKRLSGKYALDIQSQHVEGSFVAQNKTSHDLQCE